MASTLPPTKPAPPPGKRHDPAYEQKKGSILDAKASPRPTLGLPRVDKTDFSDLMQALPDQWLAQD
jgi:hypothetical protein